MSIVTLKTVKASNVLPSVKMMNQSAPHEDEARTSCQGSDGDEESDSDGDNGDEDNFNEVYINGDNDNFSEVLLMSVMVINIQ